VTGPRRPPGRRGTRAVCLACLLAAAGAAIDLAAAAAGARLSRPGQELLGGCLVTWGAVAAFWALRSRR
jgi:hypothetical protein